MDKWSAEDALPLETVETLVHTKDNLMKLGGFTEERMGIRQHRKGPLENCRGSP